MLYVFMRICISEFEGRSSGGMLWTVGWEDWNLPREWDIAGGRVSPTTNLLSE